MALEGAARRRRRVGRERGRRRGVRRRERSTLGEGSLQRRARETTVAAVDVAHGAQGVSHPRARDLGSSHAGVLEQTDPRRGEEQERQRDDALLRPSTLKQ